MRLTTVLNVGAFGLIGANSIKSSSATRAKRFAERRRRNPRPSLIRLEATTMEAIVRGMTGDTVEAAGTAPSSDGFSTKQGYACPPGGFRSAGIHYKMGS
ncbi:hypothetical protein AE621_24815 [Acidovorax sp. SD340]|nr:hypothetical protein AE621_24815 [Acidovorax sp. SD340]